MNIFFIIQIIKYIMPDRDINIELKEIPFFMIITKPNKHKIQTKIITESAKNLDEIKKKAFIYNSRRISCYK